MECPVRQLAPAFRHLFFGGTAGDQFVQYSLAGLGTQHTSQALDVLAFRAVPADNDCYAAIGHIDAFVEYAPADQLAVLASTKALQDRASFLGGRFIGVM